MFRALAGLGPGSTTPPDYDGNVLKTHTFRPEDLEGVERGIFLFGDPVSSVISTRRRRWQEKHFINCGAEQEFSDEADIYGEDILNYERMYDSWAKRLAFPHLMVRYESLYENIAFIESWLGFKLELPEKKKRSTAHENVPVSDLDKIRLAYKSLIIKVDQAADVSVYGK